MFLCHHKILHFLLLNIRWNIGNITIARLYNNNLRNIYISILVNKKQKKIADFLTLVDIKIEKLGKKISLNVDSLMNIK